MSSATCFRFKVYGSGLKFPHEPEKVVDRRENNVTLGSYYELMWHLRFSSSCALIPFLQVKTIVRKRQPDPDRE